MGSYGPWTPPSSLQNRPVAVLGGGVLGRRIACSWVAGGYDVNIRDPVPAQLAAAVKYVETHHKGYIEGVISRAFGKVQTFQGLKEAVRDAWLVIEAVPENLQLKIDTFAELEKLAPQDAILASNSSSYKSGEMVKGVGPATRRRIINTHYYIPPERLLVELMTDGETEEAIFPFLMEKFRAVGMHPIRARKESTGFVFNRIWAAIKRECLNVLSEGVSDPEELDMAFKGFFGVNVSGPCELMDTVGLDTVALIEDHYIAERHLSGQNTVDFLRKNYISQGKLGAKSSKGGLYAPPDLMKEMTHAPTLYFLDIGLAHRDNPLHSGRVLVGSADGRPARTLIDGEPVPDGLDISPSAGRLFWTNMGAPSENDGNVKSCNLDGTDIQTIIPDGAVHTPKQLFIDHKNSKLYFCDREGLRVMRCDFDGKNHETLVKNGDWQNPAHQADITRWCVGITVSPEEGVLYWTQKGPSKSNRGRILRANMKMPAGCDATNRNDIECLFFNLPEPIDVEIDPETQTLYWTDRGELPFGNSLNRAKLSDINPDITKRDGSMGRGYEILVRNLHEGIGLKLDMKNKCIFITDLGGCVYMTDLNGGNKKKMYEEDEASYTGIGIAYL
ncbi:MAG: hypothetical protein M1834_005716 [Cirrosporium novae-zelandiae]|nr:MAG: hypothetical protein M1834_005716 [Cirrosporium novae-zelandiae]